MAIDLMMPEDPDVHVKPVNDYVRDMADSLRFCYATTRVNLKRHATMQKKYYDRKLNYAPYKVGDAVMLRVFRFVKGEKYRHHFEGPYYITKVIGDVTYRISKTPDGVDKVRHYDSLRPCLDGGAPESFKGWVYAKAREHRYRFGLIKDMGAQHIPTLPTVTEERVDIHSAASRSRNGSTYKGKFSHCDRVTCNGRRSS